MQDYEYFNLGDVKLLSGTLLKSRDVDSVSSSMLDHFTKEFLVNIPMNLSADKSLLIKHISDIYRAKGTSPSYDFLFKSLYDIQDLIFYTPKIDLLKLSSGNWQQDQSIRIISSDPISSFESHSIVGKQSGATGIVNRIENFAAGVFNVTELFLTDIVGTFIVGESVGSNDVDGVFGNGVSQGLLSEVVISSAGSNYKVNDKLTFTGGGGVEAKAKVTSVGQGTLTRFTVFDGGDGYVEDKALDVNNFATFGTGFEGFKEMLSSPFTEEGRGKLKDYAKIFPKATPEEELIVPKLAEEAMYKWIAYGCLSAKANTPEYLVARFKKEKYAETRKAKIRLSNIKLEEITQIFRRKAEQIKH